MSGSRFSRLAGCLAALACVSTSLAVAGTAEPAAAVATGPGGVAGAMLWLRADAGVTHTGADISVWTDQSSSAITATGVNTPTWTDGSWNFNPAVNLSRPSGEYFTLPSGFADFTAGLSSFAVYNPTATPSLGFERIFDLGGGVESNNLLLMRAATTGDIAWESWQGSTRPNRPQAPGFTTNQKHLTMLGLPSGSAGATVTPTIRVTGAARTGLLSSTVPANVTRTSNFIGKSNWALDDLFSGALPELILFNTELSATDRAKVESYLAAKYGLTLDQVTAQSYLASNGTTKMWDHTVANASTYDNDITIIGRDDAGGLDQRQSLSQNASGLVTVANGGAIAAANSANSSAFSADLSFMALADDAGADTSWTATDSPQGTRVRLAREWLVQETGSVGTVTIRVPDDSSSVSKKLPAEPGRLSLLVDDDGVFASGATEIPMTLNGTYWEVSTDLAAGKYLTFASLRSAPGGVATGLQMWYRADAGITRTAGDISSWVDQSPNAVAAAGVNTPTWADGAWNFNPTVSFARSSNEYFTPGTWPPSFTAGLTNFTAYRPGSGSGSFGVMWDFGAASTPNTVNGNVLHFRNGTSSDVGYESWYNNGGSQRPVAAGFGVGESFISTYTQPAGSVGAAVTPTIRVTGASRANTLTVAVPNNGPRSRNFIGASNFNTNTSWDGAIPELIMYNAALSASDRSRVESYLAAKYGLTLDQTTAQSYVASDGSTRMWDHTAAGASSYNKNITIIGRDDDSGLLQRQSKNVAADALATLALGTTVASANSANTSTFAADRTFLAVGDDAGAVASWSSTERPGAGWYRIAREWDVQEVGSAGTVTVSVPGSTSSASTKLPATSGPMYMLVDADGDFTSGATSVPMTASGTDHIATLDRSLGLYLTFATFAAPATPGAAPDLDAGSDSGVSATDDVTSDATPAVSAACASGNTVTFYVDGVASGSPVTCSAGAAGLVLPSLSNGARVLTFTETDPASGGQSAASPGLTVTVDTAAPSTPSSAPDLDAASDSGVSATDDVTADATPAVSAVCVTGNRVRFLVDGVADGSPVTCSAGAAGLVLSSLGGGDRVVTFTETDAAGNESGASPGLTVTVDTAAPSTPGSAPDLDAGSDSGVSATDDVTSDATPAVSAVCLSGNRVRFFVQGVDRGSVSCSGGAAGVVVPSLSDGAHGFTFTETDGAGNESSTSPELSVTIDTTAPATPSSAPDLDAASDTGASSTDDVTSDATPAVTAACGAGNRVRFLVGGLTQGSLVACSDGSAGTALGSLADGVHAVTFTETDGAGNESGQSAQLTITIDTTSPPSTTSTTSAPASTTTSSTTTSAPSSTTTSSTTTSTTTTSSTSTTTSTVSASSTTTTPSTSTVSPSTTEADAAGTSTTTTAVTDVDNDLVLDPIDPDDDNDLIDDAEEDLAPNGDGNGDGIADRRQASVATVQNPVIGGASTLTINDEGGCSFRTAEVLDGPQAPTDENRTFPAGLFQYVLDCPAPGMSAEVKIYVGSDLPATGWVARKYTGGTFSDFAAMFGIEEVGTRSVRSMTFRVVDGGRGDDDGTANATIIDPIGPSVDRAMIDRTDSPGELAYGDGLADANGDVAVVQAKRSLRPPPLLVVAVVALSALAGGIVLLRRRTPDRADRARPPGGT